MLALSVLGAKNECSNLPRYCLHLPLAALHAPCAQSDLDPERDLLVSYVAMFINRVGVCMSFGFYYRVRQSSILLAVEVLPDLPTRILLEGRKARIILESPLACT